MEEEESVEFKTVKACAVRLGKALKGAGMEIGMVDFLKEKGFITEGVRLKVIGMTTPLGDDDKTTLLVEGIKNRIEQDEDSFHVLVDKFKKSGVLYEPIVKKLTKEYEKQYAAANPNMSSAATTSGGSGGGGATDNHSASQPNTAASQSTSKTLSAAAVDSRTLSTDDLLDVLGAVESLAGQWKDLCLSLHIKESTLSVIDANNHKDVHACLRTALGEWLKWNYDHEIYGQPNWKMLAEAVSSRNPALSNKIATAHMREM